MNNIELTFDDIYPPAALQARWGMKAKQTADESRYMRRRIAEWCAEQGALRATAAILEVMQ